MITNIFVAKKMAAWGGVVKFGRPVCGRQWTRGMATLKELSIRLKSVTNIEKITKSMKMVSAAKYQIAERELKPARTYGIGAQALFDKAGVVEEDRKPRHLIIALSSDRGLCGSIHSNIAKNIRGIMAGRGDTSAQIVCIGDKIRTIMQRFFRGNVLMHFANIGKRPPVFSEASFITQEILNSGYDYDSAEIVFNRFRNVISYRTENQALVPHSSLSQSDKILLYDSVDDEVLRSFHEMSLANLIFYAMKEGACSEQSSRMTAMDAASKNAGEMIDKLTLTYNRTRQAVITRELIEIISGAAAV